MLRRAVVLAVLALLAVTAAARADWNGDFHGDVLGVDPEGQLILYTPPGDGTFGGIPGGVIGTGWGPFDTLVTPGDFSGDGFADILARLPGGELLLYRGTGTGGFIPDDPRPSLGLGWDTLDALITPGDWDGNGTADVLARDADDGRLLLYRGTGAGAFTGAPTPLGTGWAQYTALLSPGDFSGDGRPDVLARTAAGELLMFRGDGAGGFKPGSTIVGVGWQGFTALIGGDFNSDGKPDLLARDGGRLLRYGGNGAGGFLPDGGTEIGTSGWDLRANLMLSGGSPPGTVVGPAPPEPTVAPSVLLQAGLRCTPPGQRLRVALRVRKPTGRSKARVRKIVFAVRGGQRRTDRKAPYRARLRTTAKPGSKVRVTARVFYTRPGSRKLRRQSVSKRYAICA